jgi:hypothetical protein
MMRSVFAVVLVCLFNSAASAEIVLSVESGKVFFENSGVHQINLFITGGPSSTDFLTSDIILSAGAFAPNDNGFSEQGLEKTGIFGQDGYLGNGNLQATSFLVFAPSDSSSAVFGMDFISQQSVPLGPSLLATLTIDVNGLAPGNYSIDFDNLGAQGAISGLSGSFAVTAVPEPSSVLVLTCAVGLFASKRYRKRKGSRSDVSLAS